MFFGNARLGFDASSPRRGVDRRLVRLFTQGDACFAERSEGFLFVDCLVLLKHPSRSEELQAIWEEVLRPLGARGGGALVKLGVIPLKALHPALLAFQRHLTDP